MNNNVFGVVLSKAIGTVKISGFLFSTAHLDVAMFSKSITLTVKLEYYPSTISIISLEASH